MNNQKTVPCKACKKPATMQVNPDDWEDAPAAFTITIECSGLCKTIYVPCTPQQMQELTGLPVSGWRS